jgi:5-methylcytosine-specific restriction endonuclease McrA
MDIISRKEAKLVGSKLYFTGKPCKNGHICERRTVNGCCEECGRQKSLKYAREHAEQHRINARANYYRDPEKNKAKANQWRLYHPERAIEIQREGRARNLDFYRARHREWKANNPEKVNAANAKRRADRFHATPAWVDLNAIKQVYLNRPEGMQVDHIVPLKSAVVCGLHVPWNLQYLTPEENNRKHNNFEPQFLFLDPQYSETIYESA